MTSYDTSSRPAPDTGTGVTTPMKVVSMQPQGVNYIAARQHVWEGGKARRMAWLDPQAYIYYRVTHIHLDGTPIGCIFVREPTKQLPVDADQAYLPYGMDLASNDWILMEK